MDFDSTIQLFQTLKEIGLTANEANIYLALHGLGMNPASTVAKNVGMNRSSCYTILNSLTDKGFTQKSLKNNVLYFNTTDPQLILEQLKMKKGKLDNDIKNVSTVINQFNSLKQDYQNKPTVKFFEGSAAIKNVMEDTLKNGNKLLRAYASLDELTAILPDYWPGYYKRRTKQGINVKAIYPANKLSYLHKKRDEFECRESRLIPPEFDFHLDIMIYDNKVALTSLKEKFGLVIESDEMSQAHKKIFDLVWAGTNKYDSIMTNLMRQQYEPNETADILN